jgi:hypothetical protein
MLLSTIFATIFLANNLYPTSASPMLFEGSVTGGESLNLRTNSVAPEDQKCPQVSQWHGRVCHPEQGDRAWEDICRHEGLYTYYMRPGMCPEDTMCQTIMNVPNEPDPRDTISCVPRATNRNQLDPNRQIGVYMVQGSSAGPAQRRVSVKLETDLAGASVSALLEGAYQIPY